MLIHFRWLLAPVLLLFGGVTFAADSTEPPRAEVVKFPAAFGLSKVVADATPIHVSADAYYLVESQVECIALVSPAGAVKIQALKGPITYRGRFAQELDTVQTKIIDAPFIYDITPGEKPVPQCEIIMIPLGAKSDSEVVRRTVTLTAPMPPPDDKPKPLDDKQTRLNESIKSAYLRDPDATKGARVLSLINVYRKAPGIVDACSDWKGLHRTLADERGKVMNDGNILAVREAIAEYLNAELPRAGLLNDVGKATAKEHFARVAKGLEAIQ